MVLPVLMANALLFDFHNGFHDSAYLVATMIASCSVLPRRVPALSAVVEFTGPFLERVASLLTDAAAEISTEYCLCRIILAWPMNAPCALKRWKTAWYGSTVRPSQTCSAGHGT